MSIASAITNAQQKVANVYTAVSERQGTLPLTQDLSNLANAVKQLGYPYDGTTFTYSQKKFSIPNIDVKGKSSASNIALPDYTIIASVDGCMGATGYNYMTLSGDEYNNFIKLGYPTINTSTGVISGFSTSAYLNLPYAFNPANNPWEAKFKIKTGSDITSGQHVFRSCISAPDTAGRYGIDLSLTSKHFVFATTVDGTTWTTGRGTYTVLTSTTYWLKFGWSGTEYYVEYSTDGTTYTRDITVSSTSGSYNGFTISQIGIYSYDNAFKEPWKGTIYLSDCEIYMNGLLWWSPQAGVPSERAGLLATTDDGSAQTWNLFYNNGFVLDTASTKSGYDWCGSLSVPSHTVYPAYRKGDYSITTSLSYAGYRVLGFASNKWILTNYTFSMTAEQFTQGFTMQVHFITPPSYSGYEKIFCCGNGYENGPYAGLGNGNGIPSMGLSTGGTVLLTITSNTALLRNTEYWLRMYKEDSSSDTLLQISTDGINWTTVGTSSTTISQTITANRTMILGCNAGATGEYFRGQIDLRDTFIEIAGTKVWQTLIND